MSYAEFNGGQALALEHIKEYGVGYARNVIDSIMRTKDFLLNDFAEGYLVTVEMEEAFVSKKNRNKEAEA